MSEKVISAHKFVEYAFASPQKRVTIIESALLPPTYILDTKYPDIERATGNFLLSGCTDQNRLAALDQAYQKLDAYSDHHEQRLLNAMDAISHITNMHWPLVSTSEVEGLNGLPTDMEIGGIIVRVKPSVILKRNQSGFKHPFIGVAKIYFGKTQPLRSAENAERGVLFATLLHWFTEEALDFIGSSDPKMCFVADIFDEQTHFAASRYKQRRKQLEALALEIADRWEHISDRLQSKEQKRDQFAGKK